MAATSKNLKYSFDYPLTKLSGFCSNKFSEKLRWILIFTAPLILQSCASGLLLEGLAAEEVALIGRTALLRQPYGLALRGSTLVVAEENLFFSQLRRVKIEPPSVLRPSRLYVNENGVNRFFGIAEGSNIKLIDYVDRRIPLPNNSTLYRVRQNANIRIGPGKNYAIYKVNGENLPPLQENNVVLVLRRIGDWSEVQIGKDETGFILTALLSAVVINNGNNTENVACDACSGRGFVYKELKCLNCNGSTNIKCSECDGKGKFTCPECHGDTKFTCHECNGKTKFTCPDCNGKTKFKCVDCNGKGFNLTFNGIQNCNKCFRAGTVPCNNCYQRGTIPCNTCFQRGTLPCNKCYQRGTIPCNNCFQSGSLKCNVCNRTGSVSEKYQCSKCDGSGFIKNISYTDKRSGVTSTRLKFTDEFNDNTNLWPTNYFSNDLNCNIVNGKYRMENKSRMYYTSTIYVPIELNSNYTISCSSKHVSGIINRGHGLVFSFKDNDNHYRFEIADGNYILGRVVNGKFEDLIPWTLSSEIKNGQEINTLRVVKSESSLSLFINNIYVNKVYNFSDFGRKVGFVVEDNQTVEFDKLVINQ